MSDNNKKNSDQKLSRLSLTGNSRAAVGNAKTVTVEVRRKRMNLLDRKKALENGAPLSSKDIHPSETATMPHNLTHEEVNTRLQALRYAAQKQENELKKEYTENHSQYKNNDLEEEKNETTQDELAKSSENNIPLVSQKSLQEKPTKVEDVRGARKENKIYQKNPSSKEHSPQKTQKEKPIVPIILRAASYGPSPKQRALEKEIAKKKSEERVRPPKENSVPANNLPPEPFSHEIKTTYSKPLKSKKNVDDFENSEGIKKGLRRSSFDAPRKLSRHILTRVMDDEEETRFRSIASYKRAQKKRLGFARTEETKVIRDVIIPDTIMVGELSNRMAVSSALVIKSLMKLGILASINKVIDGDTAELICVEFGHRPKRTSNDDIEINIQREKDRPEDLRPRPPIITVMGHVDHGKTSLLDALKKTDVISTEFGGITQHIGAYQIVTPFSDAKITFLDTPGHAAFSEMRARGANITDIIVLVVAADDSVNAQTVEAIAHAKAAHAVMIIAINKIDKPTADPQRIKNELLNHEIVLEDFGGDIMSVEISAKKGKNLDKLVETILLQAEILELKANPNGPAEGTIIEAFIEKGRGIVATVLVRKGTLHPGDIFVAGMEFGRVKTMHDFRNQKIEEAEPSCPVEILGFNGIPMAGDEFIVVETEQKAREVAEHRRQIYREKESLIRNHNSIENMMTQIATSNIKEFNIILKADTQGSLEAITSNISKLSVEGVQAKVIHGAIGNINETDTMLAKASQACIIGFNVKATPQAKILADREGIIIGYYTIVYEIFEHINLMMKGLIAPKFEEKSLGKAELRVVFSKGKVIKIAGCYVLSGLIRRLNTQIRIYRDNEIIFTGKIDTMKHEKDDIKEAKEGHECGIIVDGFNNLKEGDIIECFEMIEVAQK